MRAPALKDLPALLVPTAAAWVLAARGAVLPPAVLVLSAGVAALALLAGRRVVVGAGTPAAWGAALLAWTAADAAVRPVAAFGATRVVAAGAVALALFLAAAAPRTVAWGRIAVVSAGACAAVWMTVERALHATRPAGPFGNPDQAATLVLVGVATAPLLGAPPLLRGLLVVAGAAGVVASGSRGALLGLVAVAAVWGMVARRRRALLAAAAVVAAAGALGLALRLATDRDPLRYERIRIWGVALRVAAAEFPLGCGPGGYPDAAIAHNFPRDGEFARFARIPDLAESDFLQAAASLGAPGIVLLVGFAVAAARRLGGRGAGTWGVAAAVIVTSAVNSQAMVMPVLWTCALALGSVQRRPHGRRATPPAAALAAAVGVTAAVAAAVLALPDWGMGPNPETVVERAQAAFRSGPGDDALADAQARVELACAARPRFGRAWRLLGNIRLRRATLRNEAALAESAAEAFARARGVNPLDVWAALGEASARTSLGDRPAAIRALAAAVRLEPNCGPAWLQLAGVRLSQGEIELARQALRRAEDAERRGRGAAFVTGYEREMAHLDPATVTRLRTALGEAR